MTVRNLERAQEAALEGWNGARGTTPGLRTGVVVLPVPIAHSSGLANALLAILAGRRLVLMERFDVDEWVRLVEEYEPKTAGLPPTALRMIFDRGVEPHRLASLKTIRCGTAPLDPEFQRVFEERYGVPIITVYGATETAGGLPLGWTLPLYEEWKSTKRGSVGRAVGGAGVRVVDAETGAEVARNTIGLLELRAPYLEGIAETEWVRTTDLALQDDDDFIWLKGRADDVMIRGGFKVSPGTVRDTLAAHPDVAEAAVVALPDERLGQVPGGAVVLREGATVGEQELIEWTRERLSPYLVPVRIAILDVMPRTQALKVNTREVVGMLQGLERT
jgi:acyl-coenzyme A synthetase/AMP-(fatty) acid ligase